MLIFFELLWTHPIVVPTFVKSGNGMIKMVFRGLDVLFDNFGVIFDTYISVVFGNNVWYNLIID